MLGKSIVNQFMGKRDKNDRQNMSGKIVTIKNTLICVTAWKEPSCVQIDQSVEPVLGDLKKKRQAAVMITVNFAYMCEATPIRRISVKFGKLVELGGIMNYGKCLFDRMNSVVLPDALPCIALRCIL
jgi:hypothetical protein